MEVSTGAVKKNTQPNRGSNKRRVTRLAIATGSTFSPPPIEPDLNEILPNPFDDLLERSLENMRVDSEEQHAEVATLPGPSVSQARASQVLGEDEIEMREPVNRVTDHLGRIGLQLAEERNLARENSEIPLRSDCLKKAIDFEISKTVSETQEKTMRLLTEQSKNIKTMHTMIQLLTTNMSTMSKRIGVVEKSTIASYDRQERREELLIEDPDVSRPKNVEDNEARGGCHVHRCGSQSHRVDIHKWNVKFDGTLKNMSVESFIFRIENLQKKNKVSNEQIFANFHHFVTGPAEKWYWQYLEENEGDEYLNFYDLKSELLRRFRNNKTDH